MIFEFSLRTNEREGFYDISDRAAEAAMEFYRASGTDEAECFVFCPHTTAGITINENADRDVVHDILFGLNKAFPDRPEFRHAEGNSVSHIKAGYTGSGIHVIARKGKLLLGTWQGIYFCEFDGPRTRRFFVRVSS